ncbi:MAG TPA: hypothetical protein VNJ70_00040 [Thermoanaerobaculia bacterium]|nr:hypothetical protein [Thermoanaerobaculia bacterium]
MADEQVTKQEEQQVDQVERELSARRLEGKVDICEVWRKVKPIWPIIIRFVRRIPVIGEKLARILEYLGQALDLFCGTQA